MTSVFIVPPIKAPNKPLPIGSCEVQSVVRRFVSVIVVGDMSVNVVCRVKICAEFVSMEVKAGR